MSGNNNRYRSRGNRRRKRFPVFSIVLIIGFLGIIAFVLVHVLSDSPETPDENSISAPVADDAPATDRSRSVDVIFDTDDVPDLNDEPVSNDAAPPANPFNNQDFPTFHSYTSVSKDIMDIHRGNLLLVNNNYFYSIPDDLDLVRIGDFGSPSIRLQLPGFLLLRTVFDPLDKMMQDYIDETSNKAVTIIATFRTHDTQRTMQQRHGSLAARPGHSEHHTGLAFDFGIFVGNDRSMFTGTGSTAWFAENSYKYGFILRYPEDKINITETEYEPWHFRYVGLPHSYIMHENNLALEEYINFLRDYSVIEPFNTTQNNALYSLYFTADTEVMVPQNTDFDISGNNVDGFIVTISH